jgi:hypothetical protein
MRNVFDLTLSDWVLATFVPSCSEKLSRRHKPMPVSIISG